MSSFSSENHGSALANRRDERLGMIDTKALVIEENSEQSLNSRPKGSESYSDWLFLNKTGTNNNLNFSNLQPSNT